MKSAHGATPPCNYGGVACVGTPLQLGISGNGIALKVAQPRTGFNDFRAFPDGCANA